MSESAARLNGKRIGRYQLDDVVGTGAFATVYRASDPRLEDTVALKVLAENRSFDLEYRGRFLGEGRVLRRIDSPHVVRVHDLGETETQQPYLVLEYADRGTLLDRVTRLRGGSWRPHADDVLALAHPLAAAVEAVHRADVVHRDLSPGNVLICSTMAPAFDEPPSGLLGIDERLLLADLGLCKDLARSSGHTAAGGTEGFRPPEQSGGPAMITPAADLWSLSALVLWLLDGDTPDAGSVRERVANANLPSPLGAVLEKSLANDPEARHRDATEWLGEVKDALLPPPPTQTSQKPAPSPKPNRRWLKPVIVAAIVMALVIGVLVGRTWLDADGDGTTVTHLDGDAVRVERKDGDLSVALEGPDEMTVGVAATYSSDLGDDVDKAIWLAPDGVLYEDQSTIELTATSPGRATVTLIGYASSGERIVVGHDVQVRPGD